MFGRCAAIVIEGDAARGWVGDVKRCWTGRAASQLARRPACARRTRFLRLPPNPTRLATRPATENAPIITISIIWVDACGLSRGASGVVSATATRTLFLRGGCAAAGVDVASATISLVAGGEVTGSAALAI